MQKLLVAVVMVVAAPITVPVAISVWAIKYIAEETTMFD